MVGLCDECIDGLAPPSTMSQIAGIVFGVCEGCRESGRVTLFIEVRK